MIMSSVANASNSRQIVMDPFESMDRKLFVGAILLAWYVAFKSLGLF